MELPSPNPAETTLPAVKGGRIDGDGQQSNHKALKKGAILSAVFYALAAVLLITAFISLAPAIKISPGSLSRASLCREMNWPL